MKSGAARCIDTFSDKTKNSSKQHMLPRRATHMQPFAFPEPHRSKGAMQSTRNSQTPDWHGLIALAINSSQPQHFLPDKKRKEKEGRLLYALIIRELSEISPGVEAVPGAPAEVV